VGISCLAAAMADRRSGNESTENSVEKCATTSSLLTTTPWKTLGKNAGNSALLCLKELLIKFLVQKIAIFHININECGLQRCWG
jgi:hypothetical protein